MKDEDYDDMTWWQECLWRLDPTNDPVEFLRCISFLCVVMGVAFIMAGFVVPTDYTMDYTKPAREMEAIEQYYFELSSHLRACVMAGMALVTISGIVVAVTMIVVFRQQGGDTIPTCQVFSCRVEDDTEMLTLTTRDETSRMTYGTQSDDEGSRGGRS